MKLSWTKPSLSRDFILLSAGVFFVLLLVSAWVTFATYARHTERITEELEVEANRIERMLDNEMNSASYMLTALGRQIILDDKRDLTKLALTLKSFDNKGYIYSIFSWVSPDQKVVVSSNRGVLENPMDVSDRDYVKKAFVDPWKMHIGRPIEGRVSGRWVVPVSMGLTDYTGKFIGTIMISMDISALTERISNLVGHEGMSFAIVSKTIIPLTQVSDDKDFVTHNFPAQTLVNVDLATNPRGLVKQGSLLKGTGSFAYYSVSKDYPYIILVGFDARYSDEAVRNLLWSRLLQVLLIALFFVLFLVMVRNRLIAPVQDLTHVMASVARGEMQVDIPRTGQLELENLATEIRRVRDYIQETKRVEDELRNKWSVTKSAKDEADLERRSAYEFLAHICKEMRGSLNNVTGWAQVLKDQLYGPIENRKYRQYASDIYGNANQLVRQLDDVLSLAKTEAGYIEQHERMLDVSSSVSRSIQLMADKLQTERLNVNVQLPDGLPKLMADDFRFQQIITHALLYIISRTLPNHTISLEARLVNHAQKERQLLAILLTNRRAETKSTMQILTDSPSPESGPDDMDISLQLIKKLADMHQATVELSSNASGDIQLSIVFSNARLRFIG